MVILSNCQIVILVFYGGMVHNKKKINIYIFIFFLLWAVSPVLCLTIWQFDNLTTWQCSGRCHWWPKKKFWKKWGKNFRPQFPRRNFAPEISRGWHERMPHPHTLRASRLYACRRKQIHRGKRCSGGGLLRWFPRLSDPHRTKRKTCWTPAGINPPPVPRSRQSGPSPEKPHARCPRAWASGENRPPNPWGTGGRDYGKSIWKLDHWHALRSCLFAMLVFGCLRRAKSIPRCWFSSPSCRCSAPHSPASATSAHWFPILGWRNDGHLVKLSNCIFVLIHWLSASK